MNTETASSKHQTWNTTRKYGHFLVAFTEWQNALYIHESFISISSRTTKVHNNNEV